MSPDEHYRRLAETNRAIDAFAAVVAAAPLGTVSAERRLQKPNLVVQMLGVVGRKVQAARRKLLDRQPASAQAAVRDLWRYPSERLHQADDGVLDPAEAVFDGQVVHPSCSPVGCGDRREARPAESSEAATGGADLWTDTRGAP